MLRFMVRQSVASCGQPTLKQAVPLENFVQLNPIKCFLFPELIEATLVFGAAEIECNCSEVLGAKNTRLHSADVPCHALFKSFFEQGLVGREKLNRPTK